MKQIEGNKMMMQRRNSFRFYILFSIAFLLVSLIIFLPFLIYNKSLVWSIDGYLQWYPLLVKMKSVLIDFFSGNGFPFWSWDFGLGGDFIGNFAHVFFDPFNYVAVFFSKEHMDIAYSLIIILKIYASGLMMLTYLRYHKKTYMVCIIGALGYAFCSWSLMGIRHDSFMTQLVIFPLLILGVDKVEDKKNPLLLIIGTFLSVITSLYFSYMSAIFVFIYIILRYILLEQNKSVLHFIKKMVRYMLYAIVGGVLLAAPILVSVLYSLMRASTEPGVDIMLLPALKDLLRYVPGFAGTYDVNSNSSNIGMSMIFVAMIPAMFMMWKRKKVSIWMFFTGAVILLIPGIQSIINGFSYSSGRWCYAFSFFFVCAAVECLHPVVLSSKKYQYGLGIWLAALLGITIAVQVIFRVMSVADFTLVIINIMFGFAILAIILVDRWKNKKKMRFLFGTAVVNIIVIALLYYSPGVGSQLDIYMTQGKCYEIYESNSLKAAKKIEDEDFYRIDTVDIPGNVGNNAPFTHTPANASIYWEVPSLYEYLSTIDNNWFKFNRQLGNNSGYFRRICTYSNDNRSRMDFLLGKKYFLGDKDDVKKYSQYAGYGYTDIGKKKGVSILKSKYDTSLGYVYENVVKESDYMTHSPLEREQLLMQSVQLPDEEVSKLSIANVTDSSVLKTEKNPVKIDIKGDEYAKVSQNKITIKKENAKVKVNLQEEVSGSELYLVFRNLKKKSMSPDQMWKLREKENERIRKETGDITEETDALAKAKFYSNYLSFHPYGNFAINITKDNIVKRLLNTEGEMTGIRDVDDYMVNIGYRENWSGDITCSFETMGYYTFDSIEVIAVPQNSFDLQAGVLEQNRLNVAEYGHNRVMGSIDTQKGGILFLSVIQHDGWRVFVDGKETDQIYHANTAFMGVEVPAGKHSIELVYRPLWFRETMILFLTGILIVVIIEILYMRRRKSNSRKGD